MALIDEATHTGHRFVRMVGDYVAICWNGTFRKDTVTVEGRTYSAEVPIPKGEPYIDFVSLRQDATTGEVWEDEDDPVSGGLSVAESRKLAAELMQAVELLEAA